ncbi:MAG: hypothetical protein HY842_10655 [Bacteroidetes bacterium]|nr:hypothetical protein [Bacteroidota bacterium]
MFCLYLFALSCLPCSDGEHGHESFGKTIALLKSGNAHSGHQHCNDLCSPLCQCTCCGCVVFSLKVSPLLMTPPAAIPRQTSFTCQAPFSTEYLSAVFRPPIAFLG